MSALHGHSVKHLNCIGKYTSPWLRYVKGTLENCGLNSVWMSHVQSGSGVSSECVKRILQDQFLQKWFGRISEEETFSTYKIYKDIHEFEEYIDILPEYLKYSLLDFRTGSQKLSVNPEKYIPLNRNTIGTACQPLWHMRLELRAVAWGCIGHVICALLVDWPAGSCYAI